ncbi:uncharacterized protein LOC112689508 [Sipha flava]|uniref:Sterol-4-alpha-carboxylate 3-dehydrogenase, decarboxylating n=1 Tax=Sipha flava TaxID=143950 RepID=A0A2S2PXU3_9HEMI|nr:uncharacterized protein LOC112689508 [Sipha flava]XP_025419036.1 uncharacterized protein LOC112689508 [Sipha flava]XP_025419037.1 uncharacterized protein LOC112689508 [Sipha flava]
MSGDRVLVLGGCGFIGRNMVKYLVDNNLASFIRVVDKVPPQIAWLNDDHKEAFQSSSVEFHSANLINQGPCESAFEGSFDYAINCAGETRVNLPDVIYEEGIVKLSMNCAHAAAKFGVKRYVEVSSGQVTSNHKEPIKEDDQIMPITSVAKYKLEVEKQLKDVPNLPYTVVRPAIVYGLGDRTGLTPNLVIGSLYRSLHLPIQILWKGSTACNTIHVEDVCKAIWDLLKLPKAIGETYNLVDIGQTTQDMIAGIVSSIFGIKHEFLGTLFSSLCKNDLDIIASNANDKHSIPWAEACSKSNIHNTPLTPFIQKDNLIGYRVHLNGNKFINSTGYIFKYPKITIDLLKQVLDDFIKMNLFPKTLLDL